LAKIEQDRAKKLGLTVDNVKNWMKELKSVVTFEDTPT